MACNSEAVNWGFGSGRTGGLCVLGVGETVGTGVDEADGARNMASMVGRRAAPKGVERKSAGRSLMKSGMAQPVRKPTASLVKELQLKHVRP